MAFSPDYRAYPNQSATTTAVLDAGLRAYMLRVYNWMSSGLLLTGIVAYVDRPYRSDRCVLSAGADRVRPHGAGADGARLHRDVRAAGLRAGAELRREPAVHHDGPGAVLGVLRRDGRQPDQHLRDLHRCSRSCEVFFITAATFAATSLYGYTTKADLTRMGSFMMMGLFGIIIASLVNMFLHSPARAVSPSASSASWCSSA